MVVNFPLSLLLLKGNYPLSADDLKLHSDCQNTTVKSIPLKPPQFCHINQIHIHNFAPNFPLCLFGAQIFHLTPKQDCNFGTLFKNGVVELGYNLYFNKSS